MQSLPRAWSPRRSIAASTLALLSSLPRPGSAEEAPPPAPPIAIERPAASRVILLVRTPADDDTMARVRLELTDGGWRILEIRPDPRDEVEPLARAAEREGVAAAVRVDAGRGLIELWVHRDDGSIGEVFATSGERSSSSVLALRVAEALRARGLLLPPEEAPARDAPREPVPALVQPVATSSTRDSPPPAPPPEADEISRTRVALELGPGLALSPGGLGPGLVIDTGLRLELGRVWSLSALGVIPLSRQAVHAPEGEASMSTWVAGGLVEAEWARWSFGGLRSGLGAGGSVTSMSGQGAAGFDGVNDTVTTLALLFRTSFHVVLTAPLRLRAGALVGTTLPEVRMAFVEHDVARWGRPFVVASLALEACTP